MLNENIKNPKFIFDFHGHLYVNFGLKEEYFIFNIVIIVLCPARNNVPYVF